MLIRKLQNNPKQCAHPKTYNFRNVLERFSSRFRIVLHRFTPFFIERFTADPLTHDNVMFTWAAWHAKKDFRWAILDSTHYAFHTHLNYLDWQRQHMKYWVNRRFGDFKANACHPHTMFPSRSSQDITILSDFTFSLMPQNFSRDALIDYSFINTGALLIIPKGYPVETLTAAAVSAMGQFECAR